MSRAPSRGARAAARRALGRLLAGVLVLPALAAAEPQSFELHPPATVEAASTAALMRDLAERVLPVYQERQPALYLARLSALQAVAGHYDAAEQTRRSLRDRRRSADPLQPIDGAPGEADALDVYVHARAMQAAQRTGFTQAFTLSFRNEAAQWSDRDAYVVTSWTAPPPAASERELQQLFDRYRHEPDVPLADAVQMVWSYFTYEALRAMRPLLAALDEEDERRRYLVETAVTVKLGGGAQVEAVVARPRGASGPLPALLVFTIDASAAAEAMRSAAHGYAGIVAFARGQPAHPAQAVAFQHDGDDARDVVDWIARQPWSNGQVGMYGDGYAGFAAWAAAARRPKALRAIATFDAMAPGIDFPMQGSIFRPAAYRWALANTAAPAADGTRGLDDAQWRELDETWYRSGVPCGILADIYGVPNDNFERWLVHPDYDAYWGQMSPSTEQFARINIPALTITGYFADGASGALYYFAQHERATNGSGQALLVGPYGDEAMREPTAQLRGLRVDAAAVLDLRELRYAWLDYVLAGGSRPALLSDRVNFELAEADAWRHAPTLAAMSGATSRLYFGAAPDGRGVLAAERGPDAAPIQRLSVRLADRRNAGWSPPPLAAGGSLDAPDSLIFSSEPLRQPLELAGFVAGEFDLAINKRDVDLNLRVYELQSGGIYQTLFDPPLELRASYAADRAHRHLLRAGKRQLVPFRAERLGARRLAAGSRIVVVVGVNHRPDREVNFGSGKDVRDETSEADGGTPLEVLWYGGSHVDLPLAR